MPSIFNPQGGTMKIFVKGLGEVEVSAGGLAPEWAQRFLETGCEGDADEDETPPIVAVRCPDCRVMVEDFVVHVCTR